MGDRFYNQMASYYKISISELNIALRDHESPEYKSLEKKANTTMSKGKKVTRLDLNNELTELLGVNIEGQKLPMLVLEVMVKHVKAKNLVKVSVPNGRLKAPYIEAVQTALSNDKLDLSTATVKTMKAFLEAINNYE